MRISLFCRPHQVPGEDVRSCVDVARAADSAGLHSIVFGDHLAMGDRSDRYPYGPFAHDIETPWLEPLTLLAAIASVTDQIRLSTGVLLTPLRPAVLLAKTIATLDVLSNGRVELGIGLGWQREEYEAEGLDWSTRQDRFDDGIRACRQLWGEQPVSFASDSVTFGPLWAYPRPVQGRIPLLYGVRATDRNVRRIAELGDGWSPVAVSPPEVRDAGDRIRAAYVEAGRPDDPIIQIKVPVVLGTDGRVDVGATLAGSDEMRDAGATDVVVVFPAHFTALPDALDFVQDLGKAVPGF